jgi:hypothetical protein
LQPSPSSVEREPRQRFADGGAIAPDSATNCEDRFALIALSLCRLIGAAYATNAADCWEAAYRLAEETPSVGDSSLLVARAATLVRVLRFSRRCKVCYLPRSCNRLSKSEQDLIGLLEAAQRGTPDLVKLLASRLVDAELEVSTIQAVNAIAQLSPERHRTS